MEIPRRALEQALLAAQGTPADAGGRRLLAWLGWNGTGDARRADRLALLGVALMCERVFGLLLPDAPALCVIGARARLDGPAGEPGLAPADASGAGLDPGAAFAACMGEVAERLAQVETADDRAAAPPDDTVPVEAWRGGGRLHLPRDLLFRRGPARRRVVPPAPLSIGCAAGATLAQARLAALLEVVERDAVALWWRGGVSPRGIAPDHSAALAAAAVLVAVGRRPGRSIHLLDLSSDLGVPVVAALSFDGQGRSFCCGTAARPTPSAAARAAVLELLQNELAAGLAAARRDLPGAVPGARDAAHLRRHAEVTPGDCLAAGPAVAGPAAGRAHDPDALSDLIAGHGFPPLRHDHLRRWLGIPVVRILVPGLACEPSAEVPPRLAAAMEATGGGPGLRLGVPLFA